MKNLLFIALLAVVGFSSCGGDDCTSCSGNDIIFGIAASTEICDNGDGTVTTTSTIAGITQDSTFTSTVAAAKAEFELGFGAGTCD